MNNDNKTKTVDSTSNSEQELFHGSMPTLTSVDQKHTLQPSDYSAGTIDESMLSPEEKKMVEKIVGEIDISNVQQVVNFGNTAQRNITDFSTTVLKKVKTHDLGDIGTSLKELTTAIDETTEHPKKGIRGLFQKAKRGVDAIKANYAKAESNVDKIEKDLLAHEAVLVQDISVYQQMYELNLQYYKELTVYIIAGKKALDIAKNVRLLELKAIADKSDKQEDVQNYRDFEDLCYRFEKKISDLELTRMVSIQSAPQIRMLQNNDREMLDKIQSAIANTIPLWRNQLVISLGIEHTKRALDAQSILTDKTNELLRKNSEMLKIATVGAAEAAERPIVDIETLQQCNKDLIASIKEVIKIHEQGAASREKAQQELLRLEVELKQAMLEVSNR